LGWAYDQYPGTPYLIIGPTGIGKSEIPEAMAREMKARYDQGVKEGDQAEIAAGDVGFAYLNFTACEFADLVGLPYRDGDQTIYCPPEWLKVMEQYPRGIAVFDEVNRVEQQTRQAYMQILDRRAIGNVKIPKGWVIVQTANPSDEGYQVSDFDLALLRRSCVLELAGDIEFWINWAQTSYEFNGEPMHPKVLATAMRLTNKGLVRSVEQKTKAIPTFAGMTKVSEMLRSGVGALSKETRMALYAGMVGAEAASHLEASLQSDVLTKLLEKVMNGEKIKASMEEMLDLSFLLLDKARKGPGKHAKILHTFYQGMGDEQKPMFARSCYGWFTEHRESFKDFKADWREWCKQHMNLLKAAMDDEKE
jgi:energy-coupling factor transporter ATP-binding protein EcfA2